MDKKITRYPIALLESMKTEDIIDQEDIDRMRARGLVIEPRKKEIRYIIGTTLIPHFAFKNASTNELTTEAVNLKVLIDGIIKKNTISKKEYDDAIAKAQEEQDVLEEQVRLEKERKQKELDDKKKAALILKQKKDAERIKKSNKKTIDKK